MISGTTNAFKRFAKSRIKSSAKGRAVTLPIGPGMEFADFSAEGVIKASQMTVTQLSYSLYGGQGKAMGTISWNNGWALDLSYEHQRVELETAMRALGAAIPSEGTLDAKGRMASKGPTLDKLLDVLRVDSTFLVRKGNLSGLDLVRAFGL